MTAQQATAKVESIVNWKNLTSEMIARMDRSELANTLATMDAERAFYDSKARQVETKVKELKLKELLADSMITEELNEFKNSDGAKFKLEMKPCYAVPAHKKVEAFEIFHAHNLEHLVTFNGRSLETELKNQAEANGGELPEWVTAMMEQGTLTTFPVPNVKISGHKYKEGGK